MPDTAAAQLRRILALIPELADDQPHSIDEVSARLGIERTTLLKDLESLAHRFDAPGGFVESVQMFIAPDTVSVLADHFLRPMRIAPSEIRALDLGLAIIRSELPPEERPAVERARQRLLAAQSSADYDPAEDPIRHADLGADADVQLLSDLRGAFQERSKVRLRYRKADSESISERTVQPYAFVIASGAWYLIAFCEMTSEVRIFRLDRVVSVSPSSERYMIPASFRVAEAVAGSRAFRSVEAAEMRVRYSPRIARWIAEREKGEEGADGSLVVTHPVADPAWAIRHVLQYGPDAEILEPTGLREAMAERLDRVTHLLGDSGA